MAPDRVICPRCGESLPSDLDLCDACGFDLAARMAGHSSPEPSRKGSARAARGENTGVPGIAWLLLVVGLAVGGLIGFALHSAIGPRAESRMPVGPADIMAGGSGGETPAGGNAAGPAEGGMGGGAPQRMPPQIMQMVQGYKAALAKNPKDLEALIGLANLEFDSGQWERAIEYYSRALAIDSKNADVRVDRAIAYHATGKNDVAKK